MCCQKQVWSKEDKVKDNIALLNLLPCRMDRKFDNPQGLFLPGQRCHAGKNKRLDFIEFAILRQNFRVEMTLHRPIHSVYP